MNFSGNVHLIYAKDFLSIILSQLHLYYNVFLWKFADDIFFGVVKITGRWLILSL